MQRKPNETRTEVVALWAIGFTMVATFLWEGSQLGFERLMSGEMSSIEAIRLGGFVPQTTETWRYLTAMFLHADLTHLANNLISYLFFAWDLRDLRVRPSLIILTFIVTGILGNAANNLTLIADVSLGASGGIFGLIGLDVFIRLIDKNHIPSRTIWVILAMNLLQTFLNPAINKEAHLGGLIAGIAMGILILAFFRPSAQTKSPKRKTKPRKNGKTSKR